MCEALCFTCLTTVYCAVTMTPLSLNSVLREVPACRSTKSYSSVILAAILSFDTRHKARQFVVSAWPQTSGEKTRQARCRIKQPGLRSHFGDDRQKLRHSI